jgi:hypothetical protein
MVSRTVARRLLLPAAALLMLLLAGRPAQARILYVYDLDSLAYMSTRVVEGKIVRRYQANNRDLVDIKVAHVHKGDGKPGETLAVAGIDSYRKGPFFKNRRLEVGDHLFVFLGPKNNAFPFPVPSGVRLVQGDDVLGFSQPMNPGLYVSDQPAAGPGTKPLALKPFRRRLRASVAAMDKLAITLAAQKEIPNGPWLLKLLGERSRDAGPRPHEHGVRDHIAELACQYLAGLHDPALLAQALPLAFAYDHGQILCRGFGTPKGRDFLLARVTDEKEPLAARLRFARSLGEAGAVYRITFTGITANSWSHEGKADRGNSGYLTRIARAAHDCRRHQELCLALVRCLDRFAQGIVQGGEAEVRADLGKALAELKRLYDTGASEEVRYAVEVATAHGDRKAYDLLKSPCGALLSILRPADAKKYTKPEVRSLLFEYSYDAAPLPAGDAVKPSVVLLHVKSGKRHVLPSSVTCRGHSAGGGSGVVPLPKDLPAGRYRVFFEVTEGGRVVSTGHHFETDL